MFRFFFDALFNFQQDVVPEQGLSYHSGIGVIHSRITIPGHLTAGGNQLSKHAQLVGLPGNLLLQTVKEHLAFRLRKKSREVIRLPVFR